MKGFVEVAVRGGSLSGRSELLLRRSRSHQREFSMSPFRPVILIVRVAWAQKIIGLNPLRCFASKKGTWPLPPPAC